jgi:hypothetical protein
MLARFSALTSLPVFAALVLAPRVAAAALGDLPVSGSTTLNGVPCTVATEAMDCAGMNMGEVARCSATTGSCVYAYETVTVMGNGVLTVGPYTVGDAGTAVTTGWLSIQANTITVMSGGTIIADGAGYMGVAGGTGQALAGSNGGGNEGMSMGLPGGGGGYFAPGATGITAPCSPASGATGGAAFFDMTTMALSLGSAGGAANSGVSFDAGANGGGGIELMAAKIQIDGTVSANGAAPPNAANGAGPGGGSGGSIHLLTASLTGTGTLSVAGSNGAVGPGISTNVPPILANNGGGGSGGVILLSMPAPATLPASLTANVAGGTTGSCTGGGTGMVVSAPFPAGVVCVDADGDTYLSTACGGTDCDDANPNIHPGAMEICNGIDDDCDGKVDEAEDGAAPLCTAPEVCTGGMCAVVDAGTDSGPAPEGGSLPDHLDFGGGVGNGCGVPPGVPAEGAAALALALGTLLLGASRRKPRRR